MPKVTKRVEVLHEQVTLADDRQQYPRGSVLTITRTNTQFNNLFAQGIVKELLDTDTPTLKAVAGSYADELRAIGITDLALLADAEVDKLIEIDGIAETRANTLITDARVALDTENTIEGDK